MSQRVYIAGHTGLLGQALTRVLGNNPQVEFVHAGSGQVDLRDADAAQQALAAARPDTVVLVAARVGGIGANLADPVGFFEDNLRIQVSTISAAFQAGARRLLFVGSANAYPAAAAQPITEDALGDGLIDAETEPYGMAKLLGMRLCDAYTRQHGVTFHSVVPCNLYGPGDRFDPRTAHVVPATLRRFHDAVAEGLDEVVVWGSGRQRRQLLYVDDLARACQLLLGLASPPCHVNVGPAGDTAISELAQLAADAAGYTGTITFDTSKPEGVLRREVDTSLMRSLGWSAQVPLREGLQRTLDWYTSTVTPTTEGSLA